ncbi:7024_t:CDS:1, partial [Scutellospora calospora]
KVDFDTLRKTVSSAIEQAHILLLNNPKQISDSLKKIILFDLLITNRTILVPVSRVLW